MDRTQASDAFSFGSKLPSFSLKNIDGSLISDDYFAGAKAGLVVFSCNHCPYVKGSDEMLIKIVHNFQKQGLKVVAISSNDAAQYPEDSFELMQKKSKDLNLPYPYLYDETQEVARNFDAACTPECYLFDSNRKLVYHGTINDNPKDKSKVSRDYLSAAIENVLAGKKPDPEFVHPIGCSIKWR
jgi:peroxiredoxin